MMALNSLNTLLWVVLATIASISHSMMVDTYAGYSIAGYAARGDGVPAAAARLQSPRGIHEGSSGSIFITDTDTSSIYLLDANATVLSLFAGGGSNLTDGAAGRDIAMSSPWGITGDGDEIYYSDASWCILRAISMASGAVTTVAGTRASCGFSDGPAATALFNAPKGIFLFNNTLFIADSLNHRIRAVDLLTASVRTVTGSTQGFADGPLLTALLDTPSDLWIDSNGVLYIADTGNCLIRRANATSLEVLGDASEGTCASAICGDNSTVFIVSNNSVQSVDLVSGSFEMVMVLGGGHLIASAVPSTNLSLTSASACTVSTAGNLLVTDYKVIWQVNDSIAFAVAGFVAPLSVPLDHAALDDIHGLWGDGIALYVSEPNNHRVLRILDRLEVLAGTGVGGYSGDGTATLSALNTPHGVVGDANGNLYIAEYDGNRVRKITSGMLSTVAGNGQCAVGVCSNAQTCSLCHPSALAINGSSLFISDASHIIRRLDLSTGIMSIAVGTGADGYLDNVPPTMAVISQATAMWVDFTGRLFISDAVNAVVSMVEFNANMTRHAGIVGVAGYSGEYMPATSSSINAQGICGNGNTLFLTGAFRLQALQGGIIRTYAGDGIDGTADEFVEAASSIGPAEYCFADNRGYLYYSESSSTGNRIRRISNLYPTGQPSSGPSGQPTVQPTAQPTSPSAQPSCSPSSQPTRHPSGQPSSQPTGAPSAPPSCQPSSNPTQSSAQPTRQPSGLPTGQPSTQPSRQPSSQPTQPTSQPSRQPVADPSGRPSSQPSCCPSSQPSFQPIGQPTTLPSGQPSASPTVDPSGIPPNITAVHVGSSRTQLALVVQFSGDSGGVVYCAAVNRKLTNASEIIGSGSSAPAISNQSIVLAGLIPSSLYQVYCTTASRSGVWQPWERTLQLVQKVNTTCCKVISVELLVSSVYEGSAAVDLLSVSLSHPPSQDLVVHSEFIGTGAVPAIYSNRSVLNNASLSLSSSATVVAGSTGSFLLVVALSGASVREFEISYLTRNLTVLILNSEPSTPQLLNGRFADDGSFVDLTFDSNTNSAGYSNTFPCSALLSFEGIATASCQFVTTSVIRIISNKLVVGSAVTLLSNTALTADCIASNNSLCTTWQSVAGTVVFIQAPAVSQVPTVIISAPTVITACHNLTLDLSASHGCAGRPWANFTLIASRIGDDAPDADLQSFLNGYSPPVNIPTMLLAKGVIYAFTAMLCNFLSACSSTTVLVQVTNVITSSPVVSIAGGSSIVLSRNKTLEVKALAYVQGCDGIVTFTDIQYNWTLLSLTGSSMATYTSQSQDAALFKLPTNTLTAGSSYSLVVTVASDQSTATARAVVTVPRGNIVAIIDGGQHMLIKTNATAVISAAHSFDQDLPSSGTAGLAFSWSCVQTAPRFSVDCSQSLLMQGAGETLQVRSSRTNTTSRVTVLAYDSSRSSRAFVDVTVTDADVNAISFLTLPSVLVSVPVNHRLTLSASLTTVSSCTAQWSVQDSTVNLTSIALTTLRQRFSIGSGYRFNLAISSNGLPERATLLFSLQCGLASAAIAVSTNGAPLPGRLSVSPMNGTELLTLFQLSAAEWSDPDLPLTFQFAFYAPEPKAFLVLQGQSQTAYLSSTLPAGPLVSNFTFDCSLEVFDAYNASVVAYQNVRVMQLDSSKQQDALQNMLDNAYNLTIDGKKSVLSVASTVINRVNCTLAPDCSALHRDECATTDHTCSSCLDGYQGDTGDFNTICIPVIAYTSTICNVDADCGDLQYCNTTDHLCSFLSTRCNNDCSGNGECFYSSLSTGVIVSDCKITELTCQAQCRCVVGYSGIGCAMSDAVLESRRALRADIVDLLFDIIQQDDVNYNSLISYSSFLETIVKNPYELSLREAFTVRSMITLSVDYGVSLHVDYASLGGILQAADSILSVASAGYSLGDENLTIPNNTASRLIEVLGTFLDIIAQDSVSGQENTKYLLSNFRIVNAIYSIGSENNVTLGVPESRAEDVADFSNTGLTISPLSDLATGTTISANLIQIYEKSFTNDPSSFFSDPIRLKIVSADNTSVHADSLVSNIVFTIRNNDALSYFVFGNATGPSYSTNCSTNVTETRYLCPYSNSSIVHICNGTAGVLTSYCPITTPSCNLLNVTSADASAASTCALVNFTQSTTTCSCPVLTSSARRLQVSADGVTKLFDERSLMDLAAASVFVAMDFKNTFNSADELSSAAGARKALAIILFFCTLWAGGLLCVAAIHMRESKLVAKQMLLKGGNGHKQQIQRLVSEYIESIIPAVYNETDSVFVRFFREISLHHRYFHLFVPQSGSLRPLLSHHEDTHHPDHDYVPTSSIV